MFAYLRSKLPKRPQIVGHWTIRPIAHLLRHPRHWHVHRNGVARGMFIGLACAWNPVPGTQMFVAAVLSTFTHANIPTAVAATWLTNPFTAIPLFYAAFWVGDLVLTTVVPHWESGRFTLVGLWSKDSVLIPLLLGCVLCAIVSGFIGRAITKFLWRRHILAKHRRRLKQRSPHPATIG